MRKIRPRSRAVKKSEESQRVLDALDAYLEGNIDEPVRWLVRFWQDQAAVMLYRELRELVIRETDPESLFDIWFQDYSKMLSERMTPVLYIPLCLYFNPVRCLVCNPAVKGMLVALDHLHHL